MSVMPILLGRFLNPSGYSKPFFAFRCYSVSARLAQSLGLGKWGNTASKIVEIDVVEGLRRLTKTTKEAIKGGRDG
jgi:hypothetical protein